MIGKTIGPYQVLAKLGEGGMGEVYRARDTKLNRDVAIKVLPHVFAADAERLARFGREAQLLAALNHPNIAHVHGLEESGSTRALVMELVEGDDLSQRLARGPLPFPEALPIAKQIADALEAAHDLGIIHRDLKPANIKARDDGTVKVLDFGLAKALDPGSSSASSAANSPTLSVHATQAGIILGTAAYMAPEQAHGRAADRRADIFAFGAVLFEMLTGRQAFNGESVSDTLATVLKIDPDWSQLPAEVPAHVRTLLRRCLTKDRAQRLQAIGEARIALTQPVAAEPAEVANRKPSSARTWVLASALALAIAFAAWGWLRTGPPAQRTILRFADATAVASVPGAVALSRDGTRLAFVGGPRRQIYVRSLDQFDAEAVPRTENATNLCFSPDGRSISFLTGDSQTQLMTVALDGGQPRKLADLAGRARSGTESPWTEPTQSWSDDGSILFVADGGLSRIMSNGGPVQILAPPDAKEYFLSPQLLPDGKNVLLSVAVSSRPNRNRIITLDMRSHQQKVLLEQFGITHYVPSEAGSSSGYLVSYDAITGSINAVAFDAERLETIGTPSPIVHGVRGVPRYFGQFSISGSGTLAYASGGSTHPERTLVWVDRHGVEQATEAPTRQYNSPKLSPNDDRVAVEIQGSSTIWLYDLDRKVLSPGITGTFGGAVWMPDGKRLIYNHLGPDPNPSTSTLAIAPADRSGPPTMFAEASRMYPVSVSPDGQFAIALHTVRATGEATGGSVVKLTDAAPKPRPLLPSSSGISFVAFSPDGHWIAYSSSDSGLSEVYVTAFPGPGATIHVSSKGGIAPRWSRDTRELFYRNGDQMMVVNVELGQTFHASQPRELFTKSMFRDTHRTGYDVARDGKRFLMVKHLAFASAGEATQLNVVANWLQELKARVPIK